MSKYLEKLNGNGLFKDAQSKTISLKSSHNDSEFSSKEMKYNPNNIIFKSTKIESPQYQEPENTYEVLKPITKRIMELPLKVKKKVKTVKPVYKKEIIVSNEQELNQILQNDLFQDVPLPSKSTIQNLMQDSMLESKIISSNKNFNNNMNINNIYGEKANTDIKISAKTHNSYNHNLKEQKNIKKEEMPKEKVNITYKNKNFVEEYFHDDDIPQPIVCEGNALQFSKVGESNNIQVEKTNQNISNLNSFKKVKNSINELSTANTIFSSIQPKLYENQFQKENILNKSYNFESLNKLNNKVNMNNKYPQVDQVFKSQAMNYNIYNKEIKNNQKMHNSLKNCNYKNKNIYTNNINAKPLPEFDSSVNNNVVYGTQIKMDKIKPIMELNYKNKINNTNKIYRSSYPTNNILYNSFSKPLNT